MNRSQRVCHQDDFPSSNKRDMNKTPVKFWVYENRSSEDTENEYQGNEPVQIEKLTTGNFRSFYINLGDDFILPVIVSLGNVNASVLDFAMKKGDKAPIVILKTSGDDASVITNLNISRKKYYYKGTEHQFEMKSPWKRKESQPLKISTKRSENESGEEIVHLNDLLSDQSLTFDAILCYLLIGVVMASEHDKKYSVFGELTNEYTNALSMYLLKEGEWKIPKDIVESDFPKSTFNKKSIEYIGGNTIEKQISDRLWTDLQHLAKGHYLPSTWPKAVQKVNECAKVTVLGNEYGLIFYALLIHKHYTGAKQWIRTGFVSIRQILVGAFILEKEKKKWQTGQIEKEYLQQIHKAFTEDAVRIISYVLEVDRRHALRKKENSSNSDSEENVLHSGRILLNHKCLFDAFETENITFVENEVVQNILDEMWYGKAKERLTKKEICSMAVVIIFHWVFLLPMLIFLDSFCFERFYKVYNIPVVKVLNTWFGFAVLVFGFAYMLLFDHEEGISSIDIFLIICMTSYAINEIRQICIAKHRDSIGLYIKEGWNICDLLAILTYSTGMLLKIKGGNGWTFEASKMLLILTFIMLCSRTIPLLCISDLLGPKRAIIREMVKDTIGFMAIMTVLIICFNVSYYAMLYSGNSEFTYDTIKKVMFNGYWMLFGELNLEMDNLKEPECSNLKEDYSNGKTERCPSTLGREVVPYLKALYGFVAVIMLLNILIAIYNNTITTVHARSKFHWSIFQYRFLEEYSLQSIFPFHLQIFAMLACLFHFLIWICREACTQKSTKQTTSLNQDPKFVRAFLYDTHFDVKLNETKIREELAALGANMEVDFEERVQQTTLKEEIREVKQCIIENNRKIRDEFQNFKNELRKSENQNYRYAKESVTSPQ